MREIGTETHVVLALICYDATRGYSKHHLLICACVFGCISSMLLLLLKQRQSGVRAGET